MLYGDDAVLSKNTGEKLTTLTLSDILQSDEIKSSMRSSWPLCVFRTVADRYSNMYLKLLAAFCILEINIIFRFGATWILGFVYRLRDLAGLFWPRPLVTLKVLNCKFKNSA